MPDHDVDIGAKVFGPSYYVSYARGFCYFTQVQLEVFNLITSSTALLDMTPGFHMWGALWTHEVLAKVSR